MALVIQHALVAPQSNVIPIHVVTSNNTTKFYTDNNGSATSTEVIGAIGKLYIDVENGSKCI